MLIQRSSLFANVPHAERFLPLQLPRCIGDSVCGFLQSNPAGVTSVRVCQCGEGSRCDLRWDPRQQLQRQLVRIKRIQQRLSGVVKAKGDIFGSLVEEQYKVSQEGWGGEKKQNVYLLHACKRATGTRILIMRKQAIMNLGVFNSK